MSFKKAMMGYFKCQHCGTYLRQAQDGFFTQCRREYWYLHAGYIGILLIMIGLLLFRSDLNLMVSPIWFVAVFLLITIAFLGFSNQYLILESCNQEDISRDLSRGLTGKGWGFLTVFIVLIVSLMVGIPQILNKLRVDLWIQLASQPVLVVVAFGGAYYIISNYTKDIDESST